MIQTPLYQWNKETGRIDEFAGFTETQVNDSRNLELVVKIFASCFGIAAVAALAFLLWSDMRYKQDRCIEALKDSGIADAVRMGLCK